MTTFAAKMAKAAAAVGGVLHDARNDFHKYEYTSSEAVKGRVQRALAQHELCISEATAEAVGDITGKSAVIRYRVTVSDGNSSASAEAFGAGVDATDKAPMKACTAAFKYALVALFCIPMGEDPEADSAPDRDAAKPSPKAAPRKDPVKTPDMTALAKLGGPAGLQAWCSNQANAVKAAMKAAKDRDEKKRMWDLILHTAGELEVTEAQVREWLGIPQGKGKAA